MKRGIVIFGVLLGMILAIGCTSANNMQTSAPTPYVTPNATPSTIPPVVIPASTYTGNQKTITVKIQNGTFIPASISISNGDTVEWINLDSVQHNIQGNISNAIPDGIYSTNINNYTYVPASVHLSDNINSGPLNQNGSYDYTFDSVGTYNYTDSMNPSMSGTITST